MQVRWPPGNNRLVNDSLGNDVVDLQLADNIKSAANLSYIERVLAAEELSAHAWRNDTDTPDRQTRFWAYWAAKESAYKALKKIYPELVFSHRRFVVQMDSPTTVFSGSGKANGTVTHEVDCLRVCWEWNNDWVHCVTGATAPASAPEDSSHYRIDKLAVFSQSEEFIHMKNEQRMSDESVAVRLLALALLKDLGINGAQIVRKPLGDRIGPPTIERQGLALKNTHVSLSHDGRFVSAAVQHNP